MTTVKITQEFHDKDRFSKIYHIGDVCEFDDSRAKNLALRGLVEIVTEDYAKPRRRRKVFDDNN